jgi:hypothetical protein
MNIRSPFVSNPKPPKLVQPRMGPFHHPAMDSQSAAVRLTPFCNMGLNASTPQGASIFFRVVAPVGVQANGSFSGPSPASYNRRNTVDHLGKRHRIRGIGGGQANAQGNARPVGYNMMFASFFGPVYWAFPRFFPHRPQRESYSNREPHGTNRSDARAEAWPKALHRSFARPLPFANPASDANRSSRCRSPFVKASIPKGCRFPGRK